MSRKLSPDGPFLKNGELSDVERILKHCRAISGSPQGRAGGGEIRSHSFKPVGKSADPNYTKLTCYIRKDTHLKTKKKLLDEGDLEFSDVIEELLSGWLNK